MTGAPSWPGLLGALLKGTSLPAADTAWAMSTIMAGEASAAQIAGFTVALRAKGETAEEVGGLAAAMLERAVPLVVPGPIVDTCGTGGDRAHTVNISTMAALVAAGAGARVVKHGNRAASSSCGSADLLEELGVVIDLSPERVAACLCRTGITFCFAPVFHPAMRHAAVPRRELGVPTFFNVLGPLTNPAHPGAQAVGVSDPRMARVMADVLAARGTSALVFHGEDGLDELSTMAPSRVWVVHAGAVAEERIDPAELGIARGQMADLRGRDAPYNAEVARAVLAGAPGPVRDAVLLNAAAALVALEPAPGRLVDRLRGGLARAGTAVDSGAARAVLERWVAVSQELVERHR